ncbi:hypothetical protein MUY27_13840 [Mucilaginibacter sp. RS28]|uniref:Uncharacterized protein n=1 Tax=Mucilaginibacter straminoryzae TaxID=2932774 RepID=A0A9X2BAG8_9SPHI|nr:hypothetical protein [Mucilaginibacter straminoryzae]MCJ8210795.1 hypothetical protein [Mucilaginibacter straminoryzae]
MREVMRTKIAINNLLLLALLVLSNCSSKSKKDILLIFPNQDEKAISVSLNKQVYTFGTSPSKMKREMYILTTGGKMRAFKPKILTLSKSLTENEFNAKYRSSDVSLLFNDNLSADQLQDKYDIYVCLKDSSNRTWSTKHVEINDRIVF